MLRQDSMNVMMVDDHMTLQLHSIGKATRIGYSKALSSFLDWCISTHGHIPSDKRRKIHRIDKYVCQFIHAMYHENPGRGRRQLCVNLRCAIQIAIPESSNTLHMSARCLRGWEKLVPGDHTAPMPYGVCLLMIQYFLDHDYVQMALLLAMGFHGVHRISELLRVKVQDISFPKHRAAIHWPSGIHLRKTKRGRNQSSSLYDEFTWRFLKIYIRSLPAKQSKLFRVTRIDLYNAFKKAFKDLGICHLGLVPYSWRAGGATHLSNLGVPAADIAVRGRWKRLETLQLYVQTGRALQLSQRIPSSLRKRANKLIKDPLILLDHLR